MPSNLDFIPLRLCVLTVSDSRTLADDRSGDYLADALTHEAMCCTNERSAPTTVIACVPSCLVGLPMHRSTAS